MNTGDKEKIAKTLSEATVKIKVGKFSFKVKPLTLMQIYEMGVYANDMPEPSWQGGEKINIIQKLFERNNDARLCAKYSLFAHSARHGLASYGTGISVSIWILLHSMNL